MSRGKLVLITSVVLGVASMIWLVGRSDLQAINLESLLRRSGAAAPVLFSLLMVLGILVSPIPTSPLTILSPKLFGVWGGLLITLTSATIGATLAFLIARRMGDEFFVRFPQYQLLQHLLPRDATAVAIFLLRLPPSPTFDLVSYLAGLTKVSFWQFIVATFLGMIPVTATLCLVGSVTPTVWLLPGLAAVLVFWFVRFIRRSQTKA